MFESIVVARDSAGRPQQTLIRKITPREEQAALVWKGIVERIPVGPYPEGARQVVNLEGESADARKIMELVIAYARGIGGQFWAERPGLDAIDFYLDTQA